MADTIHPLIRLKEKFPDETFVTVTGYPGTSENKSTIRLYTDLSAKVAYDIPVDAIVHREDVKGCDCKEDDSSDIQAVRLYLKSSAKIAGSFKSSAKDLFGTPPKAPGNIQFPPFPGTIPNRTIHPIIQRTPIERCQLQLCKDIRRGMDQYSAVDKFKKCLINLGITDSRRIENLLTEAAYNCGLTEDNDFGDPDDICGVPGFPPCDPGFPQ